MILFDFLGKSHEIAEKKDLDGIRVGGRNRLRESSLCFDSAPSTRNWDVMNLNSVNFREFTKSGLHYKTLVSNGAQNSSSGIRFTIEDLGFEVGDDIAISCDLKGSFGLTNSGFSIMHATPQDANFYTKIYYGAPHPEAYPKWTRVSRIFKIPDNIRETSGKHELYIFFGGGHGGQDADVWVRNVQIEKGTVCTDYAPAPEDALARIQALEAALGGGVNFYRPLRLGVH